MLQPDGQRHADGYVHSRTSCGTVREGSSRTGSAISVTAELAALAKCLDWTLPELSIAWVLRLPELTSAIVGARRPDQIHQTAVAGTRKLDNEAIAAVETAMQRRADALLALGDMEQPKV